MNVNAIVTTLAPVINHYAQASLADLVATEQTLSARWWAMAGNVHQSLPARADGQPRVWQRVDPSELQRTAARYVAVCHLLATKVDEDDIPLKARIIGKMAASITGSEFLANEWVEDASFLRSAPDPGEPWWEALQRDLVRALALEPLA